MYGIDGKLLKLLKCYLKDRKQRILLNGQMSSWNNILAGVLQGSAFETIINDLPDEFTSLLQNIC